MCRGPQQRRRHHLRDRRHSDQIPRCGRLHVEVLPLRPAVRDRAGTGDPDVGPRWRVAGGGVRGAGRRRSGGGGGRALVRPASPRGDDTDRAGRVAGGSRGQGGAGAGARPRGGQRRRGRAGVRDRAVAGSVAKAGAGRTTAGGPRRRPRRGGGGAHRRDGGRGPRAHPPCETAPVGVAAGGPVGARPGGDCAAVVPGAWASGVSR